MTGRIPACWQDGPTQSIDEDSWRAYWERMEDRQQVFRIEAADFAARVRRLLQPTTQMRVLDFGCGFGHTARMLAPHVGTIALWDASATVRRQARVRVADLPNVEFLDLSATGQAATFGKFDLILVHSVLQYMTEEEIRGWLGRFRNSLCANGRLLLSDLITPAAGGLAELLGYLAFARRNGFFWDALRAGVRELRAYWSARQTRPLTRVCEQRLTSWAGEAGLTLEWLHENLSHRQSRACAVLRIAPAPGSCN
jgi:cyclopropane fatty-acyl-phospholipid synthase-like methyltransferase